MQRGKNVIMTAKMQTKFRSVEGHLPHFRVQTNDCDINVVNPSVTFSDEFLVRKVM